MSETPRINPIEIPENPLDSLFGLTPSVDLNAEQAEGYVTTTEAEYSAVVAEDTGAKEEEQPDPMAKDEEDEEIDRKIDEVYDAAIGAFNTQTAYTELIEPRYAARNAEVAANYLNIALNAANSRARVKGDRVKTKAFIPYNNGSQSKLGGQTVVASREEIMKMLEG